MGKKGFVYLVGAGPGDSGLLTIKGQKLLKQAEVVVYDRLVGDKVLSFASPDAEMIYVGKISGKHALSQNEINALLVEKASQGKMVVRLKGGDPFVFGRGGEEAIWIRDAGYDYEVVPGITSAVAVPAYAGIPITHRDITSSFTVITGHEKPEKQQSSIEWQHISPGKGTLVFLMGVENLEYIVKNLLQNGRSADTPVALVRWGTLPEQEVLTGTLNNIVTRVKETFFQPPAVIVVGEVVNLRERLKWIENKPLWGKKIIITRSRPQASSLVEKISALGGEAVEFPAIHIEPETNLSPLYNVFKNISNYDWIIFTSTNAVEIFFQQMAGKQLDIRDLKGIKLAAIGPGTRDKLTARGLIVDLMPNEYRAEGVIQELRERVKPGQWILLPRARGARSILPETLRKWGLTVNEIHLYKATAVQDVNQIARGYLLNGQADYITFTSSSTVNNLVKIIGPENVARVNNKIRVACIGPITADTARERGFTVDIMAKSYTIDGMVEAIMTDVNTGLGRF